MSGTVGTLVWENQWTRQVGPRWKIKSFSSVTQSCPTLCDPMNHSMPGLPVHHQLPEFTQTHVHRIGDAIQPSHPLSPHPSFSSCLQSFPESGSFPMSQLFAWGGQRIGVSASASVLPVNTQDWSPLGWTGWISLQSKGLSRIFSSTTVQKHQFFGAQLSSPNLKDIKITAISSRNKQLYMAWYASICPILFVCIDTLLSKIGSLISFVVLNIAPLLIYHRHFLCP